MANIHFKLIDDTNELLVRNIKIKREQEHFIETVDQCLQEASTYSEWQPIAIYNDDIIIGFAMYGSFGDSCDTWIDRIMIDEKYQGKGYGKTAMKQLIDHVSKEYGVNVVYLSIIEENRQAYHLYTKIGFTFINERDPNGELIFKYTIA
ncbi:GNAT family N-acetyltransferase [Priestia koreensis]|uniref:GNAT family N-acetyltransferase n=1 Tax=Priestia koreensis TaxID=284581 RepID=UPI0028F6FAF2|nr:GNAT family N-acetyltransferase [Priestia koreensis]